MSRANRFDKAAVEANKIIEEALPDSPVRAHTFTASGGPSVGVSLWIVTKVRYNPTPRAIEFAKKFNQPIPDTISKVEDTGPEIDEAGTVLQAAGQAWTRYEGGRWFMEK